MTRRTLIIAWSAAIAVGAAALLFAPRLFRKSPFFQVQQVEYDGLRFLDEQDIVDRLELSPGASVLDPLGPLQRRLLAIPGVMSGRVSRRLPGTLHVDVFEARPVALARQPDRLVMLDQRARVLPFDPTRSPESFPIADRNPAVTTLLARLMLADPAWYAEIETASAVAGSVVLQWNGQRVRLRPNADVETLRSVTLVRDYLMQHAVTWREIDARFSERIFVRKGVA